jgi:hypothetical protein
MEKNVKNIYKDSQHLQDMNQAQYYTHTFGKYVATHRILIPRVEAG